MAGAPAFSGWITAATTVARLGGEEIHPMGRPLPPPSNPSNAHVWEEEGVVLGVAVDE